MTRRLEAERCFPCHSPTLRPWIAELRVRSRNDRRPTWRGFGARVSRTGRENCRQKQKLIASSHSVLRAGGVFLSQAGPRFDLVFFKLSITSIRIRSIASRNDEGDPLGRPRLARYAARTLARTPPSEGRNMARLEPGIAVPPARDRRGGRRFGKAHWGLSGRQHGCWFPPKPEDRASRSIVQGFERKDQRIDFARVAEYAGVIEVTDHIRISYGPPP